MYTAEFFIYHRPLKNALLYRIWPPSNTATPLALLVLTELLCFRSFIRQQTCVATNTATAAQIMTR